MATAAVPSLIMGIGPVPAAKKLLDRIGVTLDETEVIELNEAFASQSLACLRQLHHTNERYALTTMCIGVGQGIAMLLEKA